MSHLKSALVLASSSLLAPACVMAQSATPPTTLPVLQPITVHASRFEEKPADALPQTFHITAQEILSSGATNVSEALSRVAGLPTRTNLDGSTNAVVDMRGFGEAASNNLVVLLDGVRLSENEQTAARTSMIPMEVIDHIEITRGGNSVLFGDGATGGTINIVTKKRVGNVTVASAGVGSYSAYQTSLFHAIEQNGLDVSLFAKQMGSHNYRDSSRGKEQSLGFNLVNRIDAGSEVGARFFLSQERNKLPGALPFAYLDTSPRMAQVTGYNWDADVNSHSLTLFGVKRLGSAEFTMEWNRRIRSNTDSYSFDAHTVHSGYNLPGWTQSYGDSNSRVNNQSVSPRVKISDFVWDNNTLLLGHDWAQTTKVGVGQLTESGSPNVIDYSNYDFAFHTSGTYLRDTFQLTPRDRITVGFRSQSYTQDKNLYYSSTTYPDTSLDAWSRQGSAIAREFQYSKDWSSQLTHYVRLSQNFRIPNVDDNSNAAWVNSAPKLLDVQTSHDLDMGATIQLARSQAELAYFRSNATNEIGYDPSQFGNVNFSPTRREGVNLRYKLIMSPQWTFRTSLQTVSARFVEGDYSGNRIPNVAKTTGSVALDYMLSARHTLTATTRFASSRFMAGDFGNSQVQVPGYAVQDMAYHYADKQWSINATLGNVFNKAHADVGIYQSSPAYYSLYKSTVYPNPGRNFSLVGRYNF